MDAWDAGDSSHPINGSYHENTGYYMLTTQRLVFCVGMMLGCLYRSKKPHTPVTAVHSRTARSRDVLGWCHVASTVGRATDVWRRMWFHPVC